jgi:hypothetical protein
LWLEAVVFLLPRETAGDRWKPHVPRLDWREFGARTGVEGAAAGRRLSHEGPTDERALRHQDDLTTPPRSAAWRSASSEAVACA